MTYTKRATNDDNDENNDVDNDDDGFFSCYRWEPVHCSALQADAPPSPIKKVMIKRATAGGLSGDD